MSKDLLAEDKPTERVVEEAQPAQVRSTPRTVPPDTAGLTTAAEGAFCGCHGVHRIASEFTMEIGVPFADSERCC